MSGFLIDGVPFVSEGDDIQGYLDSDHPGNVNEYTTTTNTGVTTPVPGLEKHNYNALKPNLPTQYKLRDVSLNENAFAFSVEISTIDYPENATIPVISIPTRFNKAVIISRGGKGGAGGVGGTAKSYWLKYNQPGPEETKEGNGGSGGNGATGSVYVEEIDFKKRDIKTIQITQLGRSGIAGNLGAGDDKHHPRPNYNSYNTDITESTGLPGNQGQRGTSTIYSAGLPQVTDGGNGGYGGNGGWTSAKNNGYNNGRTEAENGNQGAPGNTPVSNTYVQDLHGGPDQWENMGDDGFVKIYFS
jgi:hypothetical protein